MFCCKNACDQIYELGSDYSASPRLAVFPQKGQSERRLCLSCTADLRLWWFRNSCRVFVLTKSVRIIRILKYMSRSCFVQSRNLVCNRAIVSIVRSWRGLVWSGAPRHIKGGGERSPCSAFLFPNPLINRV